MHNDGNITITPKMSFLLGLGGGILILCTVGFFIMLGMWMKGGVSARVAAPTAAVPTAAAPTLDAPSALPGVGEIAPITEDDHVRGPADAPITLIEYSDFECPFCSRFHPSMVQLMSEYEGQIRWVYRHFPLSFHPQARPAANASECAAEQGKFWEYADALFENQSLLGTSYYSQLATELGLNVTTFDNCLKSNKYNADVSADMTSGSTAGVTGTPGTIIIGADGTKTMVPGAVPYESLTAMVDAAL